MRRGCRRGQSILEYTLLLGAIVAVIVAVLLGKGGIKDKTTDAYNKFGESIGTQTENLTEGVFK